MFVVAALVAARGSACAESGIASSSHARHSNRANGRSVVVTITDRGPFVCGRVIDLTPAGARAIGLSGLARVDGPSSLGCVAIRGPSEAIL